MTDKDLVIPIESFLDMLDRLDEHSFKLLSEAKDKIQQAEPSYDPPMPDTGTHDSMLFEVAVHVGGIGMLNKIRTVLRDNLVRLQKDIKSEIKRELH